MKDCKRIFDDAFWAAGDWRSAEDEALIATALPAVLAYNYFL